MSFRPGTFSPAPAPARINHVLRSQATMEATLFLRHGEQILLSFVIPVCMLLVAAFVPITDDPNRLTTAFPVVIAMAAMSSGFTGQAISIAFDRRYGALKRVGASGVPPWGIVLGKIGGLLVVSTLQIVLLTIVAGVLGFPLSPTGVVLGTVEFFLGVATFTACGMLLGGSVRSEIVLGLANFLWVALVGIASYLVFTDVNALGGMLALPSVALASGLQIAYGGGVPLWPSLALAAWLIIGGGLAVHFFRFVD